MVRVAGKIRFATTTMNVERHRTIDRCAAALLALFDSGVGRRKLTPPRQQSSRAEVNALLGQLGDDVVAEALHRLYRKAEADAKKRALRLAAALHDVTFSKRPGLFGSGPRGGGRP